MQFDRDDYPELLDVDINCAGDRTVQAHKCILVSRLKYFNMMFSSNWAETRTINFETIPAEYVEVLIDFIYGEDARYLQQKGNLINTPSSPLSVFQRDLPRVCYRRNTPKRLSPT